MFVSWRDGSAINSAYCACTGPGFGFQHPHQVLCNCLVMLVLGDPMPSSSMQVSHIRSHGRTQIHINKNKYLLKIKEVCASVVRRKRGGEYSLIYYWGNTFKRWKYFQKYIEKYSSLVASYISYTDN